MRILPPTATRHERMRFALYAIMALLALAVLDFALG